MLDIPASRRVPTTTSRTEMALTPTLSRGEQALVPRQAVVALKGVCIVARVRTAIRQVPVALIAPPLRFGSAATKAAQRVGARLNRCRGTERSSGSEMDGILRRTIQRVNYSLR